MLAEADTHGYEIHSLSKMCESASACVRARSYVWENVHAFVRECSHLRSRNTQVYMHRLDFKVCVSVHVCACACTHTHFLTMCVYAHIFSRSADVLPLFTYDMWSCCLNVSAFHQSISISLRLSLSLCFSLYLPSFVYVYQNIVVHLCRVQWLHM